MANGLDHASNRGYYLSPPKTVLYFLKKEDSNNFFCLMGQDFQYRLLILKLYDDTKCLIHSSQATLCLGGRNVTLFVICWWPYISMCLFFYCFYNYQDLAYI